MPFIAQTHDVLLRVARLTGSWFEHINLNIERSKEGYVHTIQESKLPNTIALNLDPYPLLWILDSLPHRSSIQAST